MIWKSLDTGKSSIQLAAAMLGAMWIVCGTSLSSMASTIIDSDAAAPTNTAGSALNSGILPDLFTGTFSYKVPIETPAGRNGMDPKLALTYRSNNGNGWVGTGWDLELGAIERSTKYGINYSGDSFVYRTADGALELVNIGNGEYRAKTEKDFSRFKQRVAADGNTYWEVTDRSGVSYLFGQTTASRQDNAANASQVFGWRLDRIEDKNGNFMTISYTKDQGQIYPDRVDYTGNVNGSLPVTNYVKFYLEARQDTPPVYIPNFQVKTAYRLNKIEVIANGNIFQSYKLLYSTSVTTRSLLASIQQIGKDGTTALPPRKIDWNENTPGTFTSSAWWPASGAWCDTAHLRYGEYNGDGKLDMSCHSDDGRHIIAFANGDGTFSSSGWWPASGAFCDPTHLYSGDFNGDGKTDLICESSDGRHIIAFSNGDGTFSSAAWWPASGAFCDPAHLSYGDFNGDGKLDLICNSDIGNHIVAFSNGDGTFSSAPWWNAYWCGPAGLRTGDFNGDGRTDLIYHSSSKGYHIKAFSNGDGTFALYLTGLVSWCDPAHLRYGDYNGDGKLDMSCHSDDGRHIVAFFMDNTQAFTSPGWWNPSPASSWCDNGHLRFGDYNGDGKQDLSCHSNDGKHIIAYSNGDGTFRPGGWWPASSDWCNPAHLKAGDFNGDGKTDLICNSDDGRHIIAFADGEPEYTLASISNGLGGVTSIAYKPATQYTNTQLPFPVATVSSITTIDGNGNVSKTSFAYSGGFYHVGERDFRGFNYAKATDQAGPNGEQIITETWFHQGNDTDVDVNNPNVPTGFMKGKPYRVKVTDVQGNKYSEVTTSYAPDAYNAAPYFNPPLQVDSFIYDGSTDSKQTRTKYTFDTYGNVVEEDQYGDLDDNTDDRTIVRTYSPNTTDWIVGLPTSQAVYNGIGTSNPVAAKYFYYDGAADCSTASTNQTPVKGNLTRVVSWLNGGTNPEFRLAYDNYGNPLCSRDSNGNTSTFTYDNTFTFVRTATNPLNHQTSIQYYGIDGVAADKGLYGQGKSVTDPNGVSITTEYDVFGRKTKENRPDGSSISLSYNNLGTTNTQNVRMDTSIGLWQESYFDGLGRTTKVRSSGPDSKIIRTDTVYDKRGAINKISLPYFDGLETARFKTLTYDPLGRVIQATNPDSTKQLACYDKGTTVTIDPNNHRKRQTRDVLGRLVKIEEYTGTYSACSTDIDSPYAATTYQYDVLNNLRFVTDTKSNQTEMRYDTLGRKTFMHDPDMGDWNYSYDGNGNLVSQTDAKGQIISFTYDALDRLTRKHYPTGTDVVNTYDESTSTYGIGRLTTMSDVSGTTKYFYDSLGRTAKTVKTVDGTSYTLRAGYDGLNRLTSITYPDNEVVNYTYDTGGNLWNVGSYATFTGYNALGQPGTLTFGNGVTTKYQYYANNNRLNFITTNSPTQGALLNLGYNYDNKGNITTINDYVNGSRTQNLVYDELDRMVQAQGGYGLKTYSYDQIGNILTKEGVSFGYGTRPHAVASISTGKTYSYDANGNMYSDGQRTITYDYDNMPKTINGNVGFVYDGNGSRIKKTTSTGTRLYINDLYECTNGSCAKYIFAGDMRIALKDATQTYYYHPDHIGSTAIVTDASGNKAEDTTYYPFGKTYYDTGIIQLSHLFTSQELDGETGLYNYNARLYDPELGKFISADSIIPNPTNPQSLNRYSYVLNNPLGFSDPSGHAPDMWFWNGSDDYYNRGGGVQPPSSYTNPDRVGLGGPPSQNYYSSNPSTSSIPSTPSTSSIPPGMQIMPWANISNPYSGQYYKYNYNLAKAMDFVENKLHLWVNRIFEGTQVAAGTGMAFKFNYLDLMALELELTELSGHKLTLNGMEDFDNEKKGKGSISIIGGAAKGETASPYFSYKGFSATEWGKFELGATIPYYVTLQAVNFEFHVDFWELLKGP